MALKKNPTFIIFSVLVCVAVTIVAYVFYPNALDKETVVSKTQQEMCQAMAQNYLQTMRKTQNLDDRSAGWKMAVDVETDLYNLCLVDLNEEALKNYRLSALKKYQ